jgi:DNA polymerase-3 subunit delta
MKRARAAEIEAFLRKPDPAVQLVLLHGPDAGLVRERADRLAGTVVPDLHDPFRVARVSGAQLLEDPARLADEAAAIAMGGGRRVVRVVDAGNRNAELIEGFLEAPLGDALIVVEAEQLASSSALRKAVEAAANGMALACYQDEEGAIAAVIDESLSRYNLRASPEAKAYLCERLGGDRLLTRSELEKLALYAGSAEERAARPITLEEAMVSVGDTAHLTESDLCDAVAGGRPQQLDRCLLRLRQEGESAVRILRIVGSHFKRLHQYHAAPAANRVNMLRSFRLFLPQAQEEFRRQAGRWPPDLIALAISRLNETETRCKSTGYPPWPITARALLALCRLPPR